MAWVLWEVVMLKTASTCPGLGSFEVTAGNATGAL